MELKTGGQTLPKQIDIGELTSWKEIAAHLVVSTKTAQRYESELGLPVNRVGGRVSISVAELTRWKHQSPKRMGWWENPRPLQRALAAVAGLLLLATFAIVGYFFKQRPGPVASVEMNGNLLMAKDQSGRTTWSHRFDTTVFQAAESAPMPNSIRDIDGDGVDETLLVWQHSQRDSTGWGLHCFNSDGTVRWFLRMDDKVRDGAGKEFGPPFVIRSFVQFDSPEVDKTIWTAASFVHVTGTTSTLVVVDNRGKRRGQYWHVGHLNSVQMFDANGDGKPEIVVGGVRHGVEQAVLIAFEPANVSGANEMPAGDPRAIQSQSRSSEKWTAFFARSTLAKHLDSFNYLANLELVNGILRASVYESLSAPEGYLLYDLAPGLTVKEITMAAAYGEAHKTVMRRQKLSKLIPEIELKRLREDFRVIAAH